MPLLVRKRAVRAKIEEAYSVDAAPTGADNAILCRAPIRVTPIVAQQVPRDVVRAYLGNSENIPVAQHVMLELEVEIAGAGAAGAVPAYSPLLRSCALSETVEEDVSVVYAPVSSGFEAATLYCDYDGVLHKLRGSRGTVALALTAGQLPVYRFRHLGLWTAVVDAAMPEVDLTDWVQPVPVDNIHTVGVSLHGLATAVMSELTIDLAGAPQHRSLPGGSESVSYTDRRPVGTITLEATSVATKDWFSIARNATLGALSVTQGIVGGNKVKIDAPKVQLTNPTYVDDPQGITMLQMGLVLVPNNGDDELTITVF